MKATEYRIGNIVMGNKPFRLEANDITLAYNHEKMKGEQRWGDVPLTEEWLLKFGFVRKGILTMRLGDFSCYCEDDMGSYMISDFCLGDIELLDVNPEYVHQLQNLYFALVGSELKINENE